MNVSPFSTILAQGFGIELCLGMMSPLGQKRRSRRGASISGIPLTADMETNAGPDFTTLATAAWLVFGSHLRSWRRSGG